MNCVPISIHILINKCVWLVLMMMMMCILPLPSRKDDSWMDLCTCCLFSWNQIYAFCIASIGTIFTFNYLWTKRCHCLNYMKFAYCAWSSAVAVRYLWIEHRKTQRKWRKYKYRNENENNKMCNRNCEFQKIQCKYTHKHTPRMHINASLNK